MSWGSGVGEPWGGSPLTAVEDPRSDVGEDPISYIFTDEADGPLPGVHWEPYILSVDAVGDIDAGGEPAQDTYFKISNGYGLWDFTRTPPVPGPGAPYTEQGHAIGLGSVLVGRNARVSLLFREPTGLLVETEDEFYYQMGFYIRFAPGMTSLSGLIVVVLAHWLGGLWVVPMSLRVYAKDVGSPPVLITSEDPTEPDPLDTWKATPGSVGELEVELRGNALLATVGGVVGLETTVPEFGDDNRIAILGQAWHRTGVTITSIPSLIGVQLQSLRDMDRLWSEPQLLGREHMENVQNDSTYFLPIREWLEDGRLKREGGRRFVAKTSFTVEAGWVRIQVQSGDVIRTVESYTGQDYTKCIRDLRR